MLARVYKEMSDELEKLKKEKQSEHQITIQSDTSLEHQVTIESNTSFQLLNQQQSFPLIQSRMHQSDD
jgi:hypothetical protein